MTVAADWVVLNCAGCGQRVYANPQDMTLTVENNAGAYTFNCDQCGPRTQHAHPWFVAQLAHAGVPVTDPADTLRDRMVDDDAIADELETWDR